jgi:hypothetical protein
MEPVEGSGSGPNLTREPLHVWELEGMRPHSRWLALQAPSTSLRKQTPPTLPVSHAAITSEQACSRRAIRALHQMAS